jgi:hypothetical protein
MTATYYRIIEDSTNDIIEEGIVRDSEDRIYHQQTTDIKELPFECELHHFKAKGYTLKQFNFDIPFEVVLKYRTTGDKI